MIASGARSAVGTRLAIALFALLLVLVSLSPSVSADARAGYVVLQKGQNFAWEIDAVSPTNLTANFTVTEGGAIDVLMLDSNAYTAFTQNSSYVGDANLSCLGVMAYSRTAVTLDPGTYYLVVINPWTGTTNSSNVSFALDISLALGLSGQSVDVPLLLVVAVGGLLMLHATLRLGRTAWKRYRRDK